MTVEGATVRLGYLFRALVDLEAGRYWWCKVSARPGEGGLTRAASAAVPNVPRGCGG